MLTSVRQKPLTLSQTLSNYCIKEILEEAHRGLVIFRMERKRLEDFEKEIDTFNDMVFFLQDLVKMAESEKELSCG